MRHSPIQAMPMVWGIKLKQGFRTRDKKWSTISFLPEKGRPAKLTFTECSHDANYCKVQTNQQVISWCAKYMAYLMTTDPLCNMIPLILVVLLIQFKLMRPTVLPHKQEIYPFTMTLLTIDSPNFYGMEQAWYFPSPFIRLVHLQVTWARMGVRNCK